MHFIITFCPPCILQLRMCQGGQGPYKNLCNTEPNFASKGLHAPCLMLMEDSVGGFSRNWTGSRVLEKMQKDYLVKNRHRKGEGFSIS